MTLFSPLKLKKISLLLALVAMLAVSCNAQEQSASLLSVNIIVDGRQLALSLPAGNTVQDALDFFAIEMSLLDRIEPERSSILSSDLRIVITRISEEIILEEILIPFEQLILRNESLEVGSKKIVQTGENGLAEESYRLIYEDGLLVSETLINTETIKQAIEEIVVIGVQAPVEFLSLHGKIAFLASGNAWLIDTANGVRIALITSGDLDGRVFSLSPSGQWLLFSRLSSDENEINSLWLRSTQLDSAIEIDLQSQSVIHFADWLPSSDTQFLYSTVESSTNPPGWLANNNLRSIQINSSGQVIERRIILNENSDELYAWWGSDFSIAPNGESLAISSASSLSTVSLEDGSQNELIKVLPFQSQSEWVWNPPIAWSAEGAHLYFVQHVEKLGLENQERSPIFDLVRIDVTDLTIERIESSVGMFANPSELISSGPPGQRMLALLSAINPLQSDVSSYYLQLLDLDKSEYISRFPPQGSPGMEAQEIHWSPAPTKDDDSQYLAFIYQGNIWLINSHNGQASQLSSDGLVSALDWSP